MWFLGIHKYVGSIFNANIKKTYSSWSNICIIANLLCCEFLTRGKYFNTCTYLLFICFLLYKRIITNCFLVIVLQEFIFKYKCGRYLQNLVVVKYALLTSYHALIVYYLTIVLINFTSYQANILYFPSYY